MVKKDLVIAVLATFCLTATLFMIIPTRSSPGSNEYDAWSDVNDDGSIDMADISMLIDQFMTTGDTTKNVNVTNFPLDEQGNLKVKIIHSTQEWSVNLISWPGTDFFSNTTRGYRQISFGCTANDTCTIYVMWLGGRYQVDQFNVNAWTDYGRNYAVLGPEIRIQTYSARAIWIHFSFYMTT